MKRFTYLLVWMLLLAMTGCGQTVVETLKVPDANPNGPGQGMTMVILPFADYSYADSLASAHRRNLSITEALTDNLVGNGFGLPVQEDVFNYMIEQNIINIAKYDTSSYNSLSNELESDWSDAMKNEIDYYINQQKSQSGGKVAESPGSHGITQGVISKIGRNFNADYIMRGRILEFKTRQEHSWAPWKRGILPFISGTTSQIAFGFAESDKYDNMGMMAAGGTWGAIIGHNVGGPWDPQGGDSILGITGDATANTILWGAVGAGLGHMSKHSGNLTQAVVQMRIWVQEASTGNVVWTNRVDVKVSPETVFADSQYDALFDQAINKGVATLVDNFVTTGLR
ncbi:MAG: hypothetical protein KKI15_20045 [Proteobacteria bacterium]|nr:hypothetical protein [Pseudomonadota bacterium]